MGTVENQIKVPSKGSEHDNKDHKEHFGVAEDVVTENGVVEVVKTSVSETKVSVLRESDSQGLADSDMKGSSSLLKMKGSSRSDNNDDDHDGKVAILDVSVVEASENMDVDEVEDLGDEGYTFSVGDFVWGKIKSHPWWPGRIYDPSDASDLALKLRKKNRQLLVAYFGDGTFAWCHPSQLKPFEENFDDMVKQSSSRAFISAVQDAVNQVGQLLAIKISRPFVVKKATSEITLPLANNAGIKEGVIVPENGIERLSAVTIEPPELLSRMKQSVDDIAGANILELGRLKAQLSAFYLSRGGYKLPEYEDPQEVPGLEDKSMDERVDVGNRKSAVEVPAQGPFDESQGLLGNRSNQRRKQKSIAEIMGDDKDAIDLTIDAIRSTGRKRRKENEDATASKPVQKRKELMTNTNVNVPSAENKHSRGKEQSKEAKEYFDDDNIGSGNKRVAGEEGKTGEQNEKDPLASPRERKKSKYLSPPFTDPIRGLRKGDIEAESPKVSGEARFAKCNGEAFQENDSKEVLDRSNRQKDEKKTIDLRKVQASPREVLSELCIEAISSQIPRGSTSLVDFISSFRSSLYRQGSLYEVYNKCRPGRKRKKPQSDPEALSKDQNQSDCISPILDLVPRKRRKKDTPGTPAKEGTDKNASAAAVFVSFWPGSTLPSKSDLITIYSKFGALNEEETDMFLINFTARVCFLRTSDAETAFHHSQKNNPFGSSEVTFELKYLSAGSSKSGGEHGERSKSKLSARAKKKEKASEIPQAVSLPQGEASRLNYIKEKLQGLTSMLEASDGKLPDVKKKVVSGMKGLLEDMDKMVESSSS